MTKKAETVFSIKSLKLLPVGMPILHPQTKEPLTVNGKEVKLYLVNNESKEYQFAWGQVQANLKKIFNDTNQEPTLDQRQEAIYGVLVNLVVGWNEEAALCFKDELGEDSAYSKANAEKLLNQPGYFWILKQVDEFIADKTRFFTKQ